MNIGHRAIALFQTYEQERLRRMYVGGKGNKVARCYARLWAWAFGKGFAPGKRWVTLEVPGRKSGKPTRFPLGIAFIEGQPYLGSMLGNNCNWVSNVRANGGRAIIERRRRRPVHLVEVPVQDRPRLLKAYLEQVPGARPHIPVAYTQPVADFEQVADAYPIFKINWAVGRI